MGIRSRQSTNWQPGTQSDVQTIEYVGFEIPDEFVVEYGLDYLEKYRNLQFIGVLKPEDKE